MVTEPFCARCDDTGEVIERDSVTDERGTVYSDYGLVECAECPICPCGEPYSNHVEPSTDLLYVMGRWWAPDCYEQFVDEEPADAPDLPLAVVRGAGYALTASMVFWAAVALMIGALR